MTLKQVIDSIIYLFISNVNLILFFKNNNKPQFINHLAIHS